MECSIKISTRKVEKKRKICYLDSKSTENTLKKETEKESKENHDTKEKG